MHTIAQQLFKCWQLDVVAVDAACILYPVVQVLTRFAVRPLACWIKAGSVASKRDSGEEGHVPPSASGPCCAVKGEGADAGAKLVATIQT
jgi:hypothetical protein